MSKLHWRALQGESGNATMEFTLCFPLLLFMTLLLIQVAMLMAARVVVQRSAYAGARAAIVAVPREVGDELRNVVMDTGSLSIPPDQTDSAKLQAIQEAVWLALLPVCGRDDADQVGQGLDGDAIALEVENYLVNSGFETRPWVDAFIAARARYAANHTAVQLLGPQAAEGTDHPLVTWQAGDAYGPRDAVGVRVVHQLNLAVPFVRPVFASGQHQTADGAGAYATVSAVAALINQGVDTSLPPPPPVPIIEPGDAPGDASGMN